MDNYQSIPSSTNDSNPLLQKKEKLFLNKYETANNQEYQVNQQQQQILEKRNKSGLTTNNNNNNSNSGTI